MTQQVVLITGALTGIGRATAVAFANKGARVVDPAATTTRGKPWSRSCEDLAPRQSSFGPT